MNDLGIPTSHLYVTTESLMLISCQWVIYVHINNLLNKN